MTLDENINSHESIIINNFRVPCEERSHVWDTHVVRVNKDGIEYTTEMKECIKCNIIRDLDVKPY